MAALSYNPLVAIQIALAGQAADVVKQHDGPTLPEAGVVAADHQFTCGDGEASVTPPVKVPVRHQGACESEPWSDCHSQGSLAA